MLNSNDEILQSDFNILRKIKYHCNNAEIESLANVIRELTSMRDGYYISNLDHNKINFMLIDTLL